MTNDLKRALYRLLMMLIAIVLKVLITSDLFSVVFRSVFGYSNISELLSIIVSSVVTGIIIGEAMFYRERGNAIDKRSAEEYFEKHKLNIKSTLTYILKVKAELLDFIVYAIIMFVLLVAMYMIRMITVNSMYIFEALIVYVFVLITSVLTELIEKYRLYNAWVNKDEDYE